MQTYDNQVAPFELPESTQCPGCIATCPVELSIYEADEVCKICNEKITNERKQNEEIS